MTPAERLCAALDAQGCAPRRSGSGWDARCPNHEDKTASLSVGIGDDGRALVNCHAGCDTKVVVAALGLKMADLFADTVRRSGAATSAHHSASVTLEALAADKRLPREFLEGLGLHDLKGGGVGIPYRDEKGATVYVKKRTALVAKMGSRIPFGAKAIPYGMDRLAGARRAGSLILVEGESDSWTLWHHGFPALGIQGADNTKAVDLDHVEGIARLYVVKEPDKGGETFVRGLAARLRGLGWTGEPRVVQLPVKDPNDLHKLDPGAFPRAFQAALDAAELLDLAPPPAQNRAESGSLPAVLIPGAHTTEAGEPLEVGTDDFAAAVLDGLGPDLLYRMDRVVGEIAGEPGLRRFVPLTENRARLLIDGRVTLRRSSSRSSGEVVCGFVACTKDLAALVLAAGGASPRVRELQLLVNHPVYLMGFELAVPGWNASGGVYYDEPPDMVGLVPKADGALDVLDDLVVDFPFKDEASRQNVYAAMLTKVMRPAIQGPTPFFLWMASLERTGKGKSIDTTLGEAVTGASVPMMQLGRTEEEIEKRITTLILKGATLVHFDNVPVGQAVDSPSLASLATAWPRWSGRRLGESTAPDLPNRLLVLLSANNPRATGEIVKRTVPIVLQPKDEHPELRPPEDFRHPDCFAYARERRRAVLEALLGIIEAWQAAGHPPPPSSVRMGGFEGWVDAVVGALWIAGATQVLRNYRDWCACADDANADAQALVEAWALRHGTNPVTATQILELVKAAGVFRDVLAKATDAGQLVSLARRVLTPLTDRPVGGWIVRRDTTGSASTYHLARATP